MPPSPDLTSIQDESLHLLRRRSAQGLTLLLLRNGITIALNLAGTVLLTRAAGPQLWGAFSIALFLYMAAQEVLVRGFAGHLIRLPHEPSADEVRSTFSLCHLIGVSTCVLAWAAGPFLDRSYPVPGMHFLLLAGGLACWATAWRGPSIALMERHLRYGRVLAVELLDAAVFAIAGPIMVHSLPVVTGLAVVLILRSVAPAVLAIALQPFPPGILPRREHLHRISNFGTVMSGISLISVATMAMPPFLLAPLAGPRAVGLLQLAFSILGNLFFAASALVRLSLSTYSRMEHLEHIREDVAGKMRLLPQLLGPPISVVLGISLWIVPGVFGSKWNDVPPLLLLAAPGYLLAATAWPVMSGALLAKDPRQLLLSVPTIQAVVLALAILVGGHHWGAAAGAFGYSAGQFAGFFPLLYLFRRKFHILSVTGALVAVLWWSAVSAALYELARNGRIMLLMVATCLILALWLIRELPKGVRMLRPLSKEETA